jgi:hypothetical protein
MLNLLIALLTSLLISLGVHNVPGLPGTASVSPAPSITSAVVQVSTPTPFQIQPLGGEPTESGCPQEGHIKSPSSFNKATITFDNQTAGDLKVYWLDFAGKRKFYSNLKAHSKYDQATWVGHVWVVADPTSGRCLKLESANAVSQQLVIN